MAAQTQSRVGAPRKLGPWLFAGLWILLWALLLVSGLDHFKGPALGDRLYMLSAEQLRGVTRLRIDGEVGDGEVYSPPPRLVLTASSVVTVTVQSRSDGRRGGSLSTPQAGLRADPPLVAVREGDTLVLRWLPRPKPADAQLRHANDEWIGDIVLPMQFKDLVLSNALVDTASPVERLSVSGRSVEARGAVAHLDLQSIVCGRCSTPGTTGVSKEQGQGDCEVLPRYRREHSLKVEATTMQSVRITASAGEVSLKDTEHLQRLELQLSDGVALAVDRAGALKLASRSAGGTSGGSSALAADHCAAAAAAAAPQRDAVKAVPLSWVRMGDNAASEQ